MTEKYTKHFIETAQRVGAEVLEVEDLQAAAKYISSITKDTTLVPDTDLAKKHNLQAILTAEGIDVFSGDFRTAGQVPAAGITFCNFCMADSGTVVLESTDEDIRLATTLPEVHFVIADPAKILEDNLAAVAPMTSMHEGNDPKFVAYITGPSRTADVERVLTIGCHGPRELHILLVRGISTDLMEN